MPQNPRIFPFSNLFPKKNKKWGKETPRIPRNSTGEGFIFAGKALGLYSIFWEFSRRSKLGFFGIFFFFSHFFSHFFSPPNGSEKRQNRKISDKKPTPNPTFLTPNWKRQENEIPAIFFPISQEFSPKIRRVWVCLGFFLEVQATEPGNSWENPDGHRELPHVFAIN